jgi:tetratricopeptide (TPR) repeat protein
LNPKLAEIHHLYSFYFLTLGRFDEAIAEGRLALEFDPLSLIYGRSLGGCLSFADRWDEAVAQYHETLELEPTDVSLHILLGDAYERQSRAREAIAEWKKALALNGDHALAATLGSRCADGDLAAATAVLARKDLERASERAKKGGYVPAIEYARAWVRLADKEQAFCWLEKACEERNAFSLLMNSDPFYDNLRTDPRFEDLRRRVGLGT